ncbi:phosphoinositide phosphatase SAC4-like isoform X3 [Nymphaea colorata]|uniref:phosphoinositide phosphatase SAC4-like isoform X3 n=1 Tax=Nymphaea colorata TaxID=210225 RepID=UPI00129D592D|nr:phosphoinositide phosphatase SAC4-like isoform X3 [Nymphaea colorata]
MTSDGEVSGSRFVATAACRQLFPDANRDSYFNSAVSEHSPGSILSSSNFVGIDWLSSSGNSCEDETYEGSALTNSPVAGQSLENVITGVPAETISQSEQGGSMKEEDATVIEQALQDRSSNIHELSDSFVQWVIHGETLCNCT